MKTVKLRILSLGIVALGLAVCNSCTSNQSSNKSEELTNNQEVENYHEIVKSNQRLEELSKKAENFSYTQFTDSTLKYNEELRTLAEDFMRANDSIAEEYIRSTFWNYLSANLYPYAVEAGKRVYDMRKNRYGKFSDETWDWIKTMQEQAFKNGDLETLAVFADDGCEIAVQGNGYDCPRMEEQLNAINKYASSLINTAPEFTVAWIEPYYQIICKNNLSPALKESFEAIKNSPNKKK